MSDIEYIVRDLQRRLANIIKRGRIHSVDFSQTPPRVRVQYAENAVTGWLPWISGRESTNKRSWEPLDVGEQVLIISESGDLSAGVVVAAIADATNQVPSISPDEHVTKYADGTISTYNHSEHTLNINLAGDATLHIVGNLTTTIDGTADITVKKDTTVKTNANLDVSANGNMTLTAGGNMSLKAARIDLNK